MLAPLAQPVLQWARPRYECNLLVQVKPLSLRGVELVHR